MMTATDAASTPRLSLQVSRFIAAPRERVFEAWVRPELRRQWWLNERGEGPTACDIDARVGGAYCLKQRGSCSDSTAVEQDDREWVMQGVFLEVVPPERLVFTWNVNHTSEAVVDQRVTVTFRSVAGGTAVTISHEGIHSGAMRDGTQSGWSELLHHLAALLE